MIFYLLTTVILAAAVALFFYQRKQQKNRSRAKKRAPVLEFDSSSLVGDEKCEDGDNSSEEKECELVSSPYDPNLIILQLSSFSGKPYMGYELHQALLSVGLRFGDDGMFHRYLDDDDDKVLFSLAAATSKGSFVIENMGSFKCEGLLLFMHLDPKSKLMSAFDLMLDTARQLTEELGGEIYDDLQNLINADAIKRLREKICTVETKNLYVSDLLDNLD